MLPLRKDDTLRASSLYHDDVIKWKHFPRYWTSVWGILQAPVNSPHKGHWRRALMFSLICTWINGWVKQSRGWWFETPSRSLCLHCNVSSTSYMEKLAENHLRIYNIATRIVCVQNKCHGNEQWLLEHPIYQLFDLSSCNADITFHRLILRNFLHTIIF